MGDFSHGRGHGHGHQTPILKTRAARLQDLRHDRADVCLVASEMLTSRFAARSMKGKSK
jgi:hypothetical protein